MKLSVNSVIVIETSLELNKYIQKEKKEIVIKRLLVLQCLVSGQAKTFTDIANMVGVTRFSVSDWLKLYQTSGIEGILKVGESGKKTGSSTIMSQETINIILEKLSDPDQGFNSYYEILELASELEGRELKYSTVRRFFVDNYGVKLKRLRPSNVKKDAHKEELVKKNYLLARILLFNMSKVLNNYEDINLWTMDEMRVGLRTDLGRKATIKGVKSIGRHRHIYKYEYLSGAVSMKTSEQIMEKWAKVDHQNFEGLLQKISASSPTTFHFILLDNASFHKSKAIKIPENVKLIFVPPYTPETNPIERYWQEVRRRLKNKVYNDMESIWHDVNLFLRDFTRERAKSVVSFEFYKNTIKLIA